MNHYDILEVSANASPEVIRAAYKSLMQRYHPDRNPGNAETARRAMLVNQAYEVLSDSSRRTAYDIELERQLAGRSNDVRDKSMEVLVRSRSAAKDSPSSWFMWLLIAAIFLSGWLVLSLSGKRQVSGPESKDMRQSVEKAKVEAARTIPVLVAKLTVTLKAPDNSSTDPGKLSETPGKSSESAGHVLFIPELGIKVGTFDPEKAIAFIERNKDTVIQKLTEKLASAKYEELSKSDGEDYLKNIVLDSIGDSAGTNRREDYPPSATEAPGRYGAIEVLLPRSFLVR
jgi:curved DNA-binding protein CbpA